MLSHEPSLVVGSADPHHQRTLQQNIDAAMKLKRASRSRVFDTHLPLSWLRTLRALVSYALLFSDIPRSGIGVRDLAASATMLEPDTFLQFGPWAYSVTQLLNNETRSSSAVEGSVKLWPYKFDTTSIVWRAFAEFLELDDAAFPACVRYKSECSFMRLRSAVVFSMIDSLPTAIARVPTTKRQRIQHRDADQPVTLTLRTQSLLFDRLHHYVLPRIFTTPAWRTNQAFYYAPQLLERADFQLCGARSKSSCPNFCRAHWANYRRSCPKDSATCQRVGTIAEDIARRMRVLQSRFPDSQVDLTILESEETTRTVRGGISSVGSRDVDISTILRVRNCSDTSLISSVDSRDAKDKRCETLCVDDYRYEATFVTTDVTQWYFVVATLRGLGQGYFFVRTATLFLSCYFTRAAEEKYELASCWTRWKAAWLLFIRVPCQCVIHGSTFPILCYVCAHVIDAPLTYEMVVGRLTTTNGLFHMSLWEFCFIAAVQMRNLWLLVLVLQCLMAFLTLHRYPAWTPNVGVLGVPGLSISVVSSWTIFGQFRSISLRQNPIISINELPRASSTPQAIKHHFAYTQRGAGNSMLEGLILDFKLFLCVIAFVGMLYVAYMGALKPLHRAYTKRRTRRLCRRASIDKGVTDRTSAQYPAKPGTPRGVAWTPVPYSAGTLWPVAAMCARWRGSLFQRPLRPVSRYSLTRGRHAFFSRMPVTPEPSRGPSLPLLPPIPVLPQGSCSTSRTPALKQPSAPQLDWNQIIPSLDLVADIPPEWSMWPKTGREVDTLLFLQFHLANVHLRHEDVDAIVALLNLVLMSDPLVLFALKARGSGQPLAFYESTLLQQSSESSAGRVVLLPPAVAARCFSRHELKLLRVVNSTELAWSDLIHCG